MGTALLGGGVGRVGNGDSMMDVEELGGAGGQGGDLEVKILVEVLHYQHLM